MGAVGGGVMGGGIGLISSARPVTPEESVIQPPPGAPTADVPRGTPPSTASLIQDIPNPDVGIDEFITKTARAVGIIGGDLSLDNETAIAVAGGMPDIPGKEFRDFAVSEERDQQIRLAEMDRAKQPFVAGGWLPETPATPGGGQAILDAQERLRQRAEAARVKAEEDAVRAQKQAVKDELQARLGQAEDLPLLQG